MSKRTHFLMWLWQGWRPVYDRRDALALTRQLIRHADLPTHSRIVLLTDLAEDWYKRQLSALGVEERLLWPDHPALVRREPERYPRSAGQRGVPNCFRRLEIFGEERQLELGIEPGDVVVSLDLDSVVCGSFRPLLKSFRPLTALDRHPRATFVAMRGKAARLHGSLWGFVAGTNAGIWRDFDPATTPAALRRPEAGKARHVGSDQAWLSTYLPEHTPTWDEVDGVYSWPRAYPSLAGPRELAFVSYAGPHKPRSDTVRHVTPWLYEHAMMAYEG